MLRLAEKAFWPARIPFPVMHVDTGHNFDEVLDYRDRRVAELGVQLVVASVQESIDAGRVVEETGPRASRNRLQTVTLLDAINEHGSSTPCSAAAAATRRRRGRRSASTRSATTSGSGTRRTSGPSCGTSTTAGTARASTSASSRCRTGPSSTSGSTSPTTTSSCPPSTTRTGGQVFRRDGMLLAVTPFVTLMDGEEPEEMPGALPHRRRRVVHRRGRVDGDDGRGGHRRGRRLPHHRARRDPRRRPDLRSRHGRPQARGLLLMMRAPGSGAAPVRHGGVGRRRQVHADRPPAARDQADLRGPARGGRAHAAATAASTTRTSRCSPTACAPSASRASRSTSRTATSRRRDASSSSPTLPGHVQYTRNMVTGASTADLALGAHRRPQGCARAVAAPRGDRVAAPGEAPRALREQDGPGRLRRAAASTRSARSSPSSPRKLDIDDLTFVPVSALHGDNVVQHSPNTPWYEGPTLLHHLEHVYIGSDRNLIDARFPVQYVIRPMSHDHHDYRGYAGQVASGMFRPGDEVRGAAERLHDDDRRHRPVRRSGRGGHAADVGERPPRRRPRHQPRRHDLPARTTRRPSPRTSTRWSAGSASGRCRPGTIYAIKHTTRTRQGAGAGAALPPRREHAAPRRGAPGARR